MKKILFIIIYFISVNQTLYATENAVMFYRHVNLFGNLLFNSRRPNNINLGCQHHPKSFDPKNYFLVLYGDNQVLISDISPFKSVAALYCPFPNIKGLGLNAGYLKEENKSSNEESYFFIQPFLNIPFKFIAFRFGLNMITFLKGKGLDGLGLPSIEIKVGKLRRFYISGSFLSELSFGVASFNINYFFNDNISSIMIGRAYGDVGKCSGYSGKIDLKILKKVLLRLCGNANFSEKRYGTQLGVGFLF